MFGRNDVGCYADGTFGDARVCNRLHDLAREEGREFPGLIAADPERRYTAIVEAMDFLQGRTEEGYYWNLDGGDLLLLEEPSE
jgi:hypothetical protein